MSFLDELVDAIPDMPKETLTFGEVKQASPLRVRFKGSSATVAVQRGKAYSSPVVGEKVILLKVGTAWVAIDAII